jgi:hypothetical protein
MAVQPTVWPWPLFQFLDPIHSRYDTLDGGSARHKANGPLCLTFFENRALKEESGSCHWAQF